MSWSLAEMGCVCMCGGARLVGDVLMLGRYASVRTGFASTAVMKTAVSTHPHTSRLIPTLAIRV